LAVGGCQRGEVDWKLKRGVGLVRHSIRSS
jgi:hypothetical protein